MTANPTADDDDLDLTRPGHRTGRGTWSILPYLKQSLRTKLKAEMPPGDEVEAPLPSELRDAQP